MKKLKLLIVMTVLLQITAMTSMMPSPAAGKTVFLTDTSLIAGSFVVTDIYGRRIDIADLNNKVVFINFWALTCVPCKTELPGINNLASHYKNDTDFVVLAVDMDHKLQEDLHYFNERKFTLNVYMPSGALPGVLFMGVLPTTAVINHGKIVLLWQEEGKYDTTSFFQFMDSLLKR